MSGEDILADFMDECCVREAGAKVYAWNLYHRFVEWYHDKVGHIVPSRSTMCNMLSMKFKKDKVNGKMAFCDLSLKEETDR